MFRNVHFLRAAVLAAVFGVVLLGCGDDDKSPTGDDDDNEEPMTSAEVEEALAPLVTGLEEGAADCKAGYLLDTEMNADMLDFLMSEILMNVVSGQPVSAYYGTYQDLLPGVEGEGVTKTASVPTNGVRAMLIGTDTLGAPLSGYLLLQNMVVAIDSVQGGGASADVELVAKLHEEGSGDEIAIDLDLSLLATADGEGNLEDLVATVDLTGNACDLFYGVDFEMTGLDDGMDLVGWYRYEDLTVHYSLNAELQPDTTVTAHIWTGSSQNAGMHILLEGELGASEDCLTGGVYYKGDKQGDIVSTGCGTEDLAVFIVVQGDSIPAEEVLGDLMDLIEGIENPIGLMRSQAVAVTRLSDLPAQLPRRSFWAGRTLADLR
jgi:hypothetical protein